MKYLSITLKLLSIYMMVLGVFAIFFQQAAEFLYLFNVIDPVTTRMWGGAISALAVFYLLASYDVEKYRPMLWVGLLHMTVSFLITIYHVGIREILPAQGMVRMLISPIFLIILMSGILSGKKEEVLFVVGETKPGHEGPDHTREHHPLHGK